MEINVFFKFLEEMKLLMGKGVWFGGRNHNFLGLKTRKEQERSCRLGMMISTTLKKVTMIK